MKIELRWVVVPKYTPPILQFRTFDESVAGFSGSTNVVADRMPAQDWTVVPTVVYSEDGSL